jgi:hypothetical protein
VATRRYMTWIDANGFTRLTLVNGNATLSGVQTQLLAQSNADVLNMVESALTVFAPAPPGGTYRTVGDAAILTFQDAGGNLTDITLPAPLSSIFLADQETVDITQIGGIIGAVVGTVVTPAGGNVTAFVAGVRVTKKGEAY